MISRNYSEVVKSIDDAETKIKLIVKESYFNNSTPSDILKHVNKVINALVEGIKIQTLKRDTELSLRALAMREWNRLKNSFGKDGVLAFAAITLALSGVLTKSKSPHTGFVMERVNSPPIGEVRFGTERKGIPSQIYSKDYMRKVRKTMTEFAADRGIDPNDACGRNSLINLAEMEVRYQSHAEEIEALKTNGTRLVVSSVHADCSDRCYPFQGRVYSLDGTSGKTKDGKTFVPLEKATDVFYTTKSGRVYKNGLLGYNCRHTLYPYMDGMRIPKVDRTTQRRESAINNRQREYEAQIRKWRETALIMRDVEPERATESRKKAIALNKEYIAFSLQNKRAYYPDRVKVLNEKEV